MIIQNHLRFLAENYVNNPEYDFNRIALTDITLEFLAAFRKMLKEKTLVVMNFNGNTTDGKSTAAAYLLNEGLKVLGEETTSKHILGNQQEYAYWVDNNPNKTNTMLQIDEWSSLAEGGANATVEMKYLEELSNIHAQTFVHRIFCSPRALADPNTMIQLEVMAKNERDRTTTCYVYYILHRQGTTFPQIIGKITLPVGEILETKWYKEYREKKFKRIELLRKHKIFNERELFYAGAIREIVTHFIGYALMGKYITTRQIEAKAKILCQKKGIRLTMLGITYAITDPVRSVLDLYVDRVRIANLIEQMRDTKGKKKDDNESSIIQLEDQLRRIYSDIEYYITDLDTKIGLFEEYKKI